MLIFIICFVLAKKKDPFQAHQENVFMYSRDYYKNSLYVSRVYWDANFGKPLKDVDPKHLIFNDGNISNYIKGEKIGHGAFSQVFKGKSIDGKDVVMKELKPVRQIAVNREILVLQAINGTPHTPVLIDGIKTQTKEQNATLIYEYIECINFQKYIGKLNIIQIKYFFYQLLQALDNVHKKGVIHRDVKLSNVIIKNNTYLYLIDWGLGEFYHPKKHYPVKVGTRYYKAPELLVNNQQYDYSIDLWSFGCNLAGFIFNRQPLFKGKDNVDQLRKVVKILGNKDLEAYLQKYGLIFTDKIAKHRKKPLSIFINEENKHLVTVEALDLLSKLLVYDHRERLTAQEAMKHKFFDEIKQ